MSKLIETSCEACGEYLPCMEVAIPPGIARIEWLCDMCRLDIAETLHQPIER